MLEQPSPEADELIIEDPILHEIYTTALTIENPLDRGIILGKVVGRLMGLASADVVKADALAAYAESLQPPWATRNNEFPPARIICDLAVATLDANLIKDFEVGIQPERYIYENALTDIAVATNNVDLVPANPYWRDRYHWEIAKQSGSEEVARSINDIETRLMAFQYVIARYEREDNQQAADNLYAEMWATIPAEPDPDLREQLYVSYAKDFTQANQIPDLIARLKAYGALFRNVQKDSMAIEAYHQESTQAVQESLRANELAGINLKALSSSISSAILSIYKHTRDPQLINFMTDISIRNIAVHDQRLFALRRRGDISLMSRSPRTYFQGEQMHEIVESIRSEEVALSIQDPWWQNRALAYVAANMSDGPERTALQMRVIENALTIKQDSYGTSSDIILAVETMGDRRVGWRLLDDERISSHTIAMIAKKFNDVGLALQISNDRSTIAKLEHDIHADGQRARDGALAAIATQTHDVELARKINNPIIRSHSLLYIAENTRL